MRRTLSLLALMLVLSATAAAGPKSAAPGKVAICVWNKKLWRHDVVLLPPPAAAARLLKGATLAGTFYQDTDFDGYGDGTVCTKQCLDPGYSVNDDDCDDTNAAIHPGASEICGDSVDDNCSGAADEGCCPCFDTADLDTARDNWSAGTWDSGYEYCEDYSVYHPTYHYDFIRLKWFGTAASPDGSTETQSASFYSIDSVDGGASIYCERLLIDATTGTVSSYSEDFERLYLTAQEQASCQGVLTGFIADEGITCSVTSVGTAP